MLPYTRFLIVLPDVYMRVLLDLSQAAERTYQQQATWMLKQALQQVMREQDHSLERFLAAELDPEAADTRESS